MRRRSDIQLPSLGIPPKLEFSPPPSLQIELEEAFRPPRGGRITWRPLSLRFDSAQEAKPLPLLEDVELPPPETPRFP